MLYTWGPQRLTISLRDPRLGVGVNWAAGRSAGRGAAVAAAQRRHTEHCREVPDPAQAAPGMGKRARRAREKRVKKRKKRRVTFNRAVTTQVIPPSSDPPRTERTRGGKGGAREQFAAAQRALGQEELNVRQQCGHTLEDVIRQVQANVTAELNYDAARKEQLALYPPVSVDAATEAARRARRLPTQQHEMRQVVDAQEPFILPSLPRRPGRCVCFCCRGGVYAGEAFCVHERCCRRWRRALTPAG